MTTSITRFTAAAALVAGLTVFGPTQAAAITWTAAVDSFWDNPFNWDLNRVPVQTDKVIIGGGTPLSALFGNSAHTITNMDVSGGLHLRNNSYIGLRFPSLNRFDGGEIRLFENARIDTARGSRTLLRNNGLLDIRDNAEFHNAVIAAPTGRQGIMTLGSTSSSPNFTQLNISGTGTFNNAGEVQLLNATMNITASGVATSRTFLHEGFSGTVNLQDQARFENSRQYTKSGSTLNIGGDSTFRNGLAGTSHTLFSQTNGDTNITGNGVFDNDKTVTLSGGSTNISGNGFFDNDGLVTLNGGSINLSDVGLMSTSANYTQGGGTVNVQSGALFVNEASAQTANLGGGTFRVHAGGRATNNADINNLGGMANNGVDLIVEGGGVLDGTGNFVQNAGTTTINGLMVQTGVTINAGTLGGNGSIRGNVVNTGGTVGPGNSPGTLTVDGDFAQGPGGTVAIEIDSISAFDILAIEGAATLAGVLDLTVDAGYAATAQEGDLFTIIEWASFSGMFGAVTGLSFGDGLFFTLDYGEAGLTLMVNAEQIAEVSEPGAIALFCIALAGMGIARRRV
jgi:hypothetical protein